MKTLMRHYHPPAVGYELVFAGAMLKQALEDARDAPDAAINAEALYWLTYGDGADVVELLEAEGLVAEYLNGKLAALPDVRTLAARAEDAWNWEPEQLDLFEWWEMEVA